MWNDTVITRILGIRYPIIQAPMAGGLSTPELVAAVSDAGGLGSFGAGYMSPQSIRVAIRKIRQLTKNPFAINLFIPQRDLHDVNREAITSMKQYLRSLKDIPPEIGEEISQLSLDHTPFDFSE